MKDLGQIAKVESISKPEHFQRLELLNKPDFMVTAPSGAALAIYCKICGEEIAGLNDKCQFVRRKNYAEIKLTFKNRSQGAHVTNLCIGCVEAHSHDKDMMLAVMTADIMQMAAERVSLLDVLDERMEPKLSKLDVNKRGLK